MLLFLKGLKTRYVEGRLSPDGLIQEIRQKISDIRNPGIWIHLLDDRELAPYLERLRKLGPKDLPLYGIPFAIKDNIDLARIPTTGGCPNFSYTPDSSAPVVEKLIAAGAIPIGKTNLDQFATGLVGVRSPFEWPRNPLAPEHVPGGSSSGSAVAVSEGLVAFSLGTDTAGSGRVPAAFNGIVGFKPSRGRLSTRGVLPACRTLDCVSIFASSISDCRQILSVVEDYDPVDAYSRKPVNHPLPGFGRIGIPATGDLMFFGDAGYEAAWWQSIRELESAGWAIEEVDFSPFVEAARLLYEGPWVAERYAALKTFMKSHPDSWFPVTKKIVESGAVPLAHEAFSAQYKLAELKRRAEAVWKQVDVMVTPTVGGFPTLAELQADPVGPNSQLGYYTNFMNLLDLCALAVPARRTASGLPFGITWIAPRDCDHQLMKLCEAGPAGLSASKELMSLILFGAHMKGLPLNSQVTELGGRFVSAVQTAPAYRMFYLPDPPPQRPGLIRVAEGGESIEGEEWEFPVAAVGTFLGKIKQPLGLGEIELADARKCHGFLCEQAATVTAEDISHHKGWRPFLNSTR